MSLVAEPVAGEILAEGEACDAELRYLEGCRKSGVRVGDQGALVRKPVSSETMMVDGVPVPACLW